MDKTAIETLVYRRERLDWKYEQIKSLFEGSDESFKEMLLTNSGRYSKAKASKLVGDLTECLKEYRSYLITKKSMFGTMVKKSVTLTQKEQSFYEAYFRIITGLALYNPNASDAKSAYSGTWNAIIERIEMTSDYKKPEELYRDIICYYNFSNYILPDYTFRFPQGVCYEPQKIRKP